MKAILVWTVLLITQIASANLLDITCITASGYKLVVSGVTIVDDVGSTHLSFYALDLEKDESSVGRTPLSLVSQSYDDISLNAFVWTFHNSNKKSIVSLAVPSLKEIMPGVYSGSSDIFLQLNGHVVDESTVPCEVKVQ
jgi:hypothetical protein